MVDGSWEPTWHPDGSSVAITMHRDQTIDRSASAPDETSIHVVSIADGRLRAVIRDGYSPAWSPHGTEIAYLRLGPRGAEIWVVGADGSQAHFVANSLTPPAWSPDGSSLVGLAPDGLFTVRPDGTGYAVLIRSLALCPTSPPSSAPPSWGRGRRWRSTTSTRTGSGAQTGHPSPAQPRMSAAARAHSPRQRDEHGDGCHHETDEAPDRDPKSCERRLRQRADRALGAAVGFNSQTSETADIAYTRGARGDMLNAGAVQSGSSCRGCVR